MNALLYKGHLKGIQEFLQRPSRSSDMRMREISTSSAHNVSTWPGVGYVQSCDTRVLYPHIPKGKLAFDR